MEARGRMVPVGVLGDVDEGRKAVSRGGAERECV